LSRRLDFATFPRLSPALIAPSNLPRQPVLRADTTANERSLTSALPELPAQASGPWWWEWEVVALGALVLAVYFTRLSAVPICGEESRWANAAREMIATGDWIVPRQQGEVFAERPPLGSWAIGLVGAARGGIDLAAIRLPSALATLLLTGLIYAYARTWTSRLCALASAAMYATFGQVMMLGRFGESEALFALFTAGSLLVWHAGYVQGRSIALVWSAGYAMAALGALTKGLQAPVYFVATTVVFLALSRDWRWLLARGHLVGLGVFAAIVGVWFVPFARGNPRALDDIWTGLAQDRFTLDRLASHVASYPLETFACLLPWSPLLIALLQPSVYKSIWRARPQVRFLLVALAITYPTVWFAAGARGRYYMPLYPCLAVLMGLVVEHCASAGGRDFVVWRRYMRVLAGAALVGAAALAVIGLLPIDTLAPVRQPVWFLLPCVAGGVALAAVALGSVRGTRALRPEVVIVSAAAFVGFASAGGMINTRIQGGNDLTPAIADVKRRLPDADELVSLGRVYHRFAYSYESPIRQVPWPVESGDLPQGVTYFCFDRRPGDTPEDRAGNDDRLGAHTVGTLPFVWEEVAEIACDPVRRDEAHRSVVIGRIRRAERMAEQPDASRPALR
jgi:4-amino-4-deoxy-L-arabinose transferase-like glycosyltransferase